MINQNRLTQEFITMVSIDSPSYKEKELAAYVKAQLISLGFEVTMDDAGEKIGGNCGNLYGYLKGQIEGNPLLFCAHMDTVEPASNKRAIVEPDGTIHSDGSTVLGADDFAGIAIILEALRTIKENSIPHRSVEVLFTVAEEVYSKGGSALDVSKIQAKEAFVLDYNGEVGSAVYAAPTILPFEIDIKGKAAHAGFTPESGIHAVKAAADAISRIKMGKIDEDTTVNIGLIHGGTATNIVPERCIVRGEIRSYRHERALREWSGIQEIFRDAVKEIGAAVWFHEEQGIQAFEVPLNSSVVKRFKSACASLGLMPDLTRTFGGSDHNVLAKHGIEGLVLASAMHDCHTCGEYTNIEELHTLCELIIRLMTV